MIILYIHFSFHDSYLGTSSVILGILIENVTVTSRSDIPDTNRSFIVLSKPFLYVVLLFFLKKKTKTIVTVSKACCTNSAHYAPFSLARCLTTEQYDVW